MPVADLSQLHRRPALIARGLQINQLIKELQATVAELTEERRQIIGDLMDTGLSKADVAARLRLSRVRITQITGAGPAEQPAASAEEP
jgi:DNA-directed RNA polymerase specialized sigma subunit